MLRMLKSNCVDLKAVERQDSVAVLALVMDRAKGVGGRRSRQIISGVIIDRNENDLYTDSKTTLQ